MFYYFFEFLSVKGSLSTSTLVGRLRPGHVAQHTTADTARLPLSGTLVMVMRSWFVALLCIGEEHPELGLGDWKLSPGTLGRMSATVGGFQGFPALPLESCSKSMP